MNLFKKLLLPIAFLALLFIGFKVSNVNAATCSKPTISSSGTNTGDFHIVYTRKVGGSGGCTYKWIKPIIKDSAGKSQSVSVESWGSPSNNPSSNNWVVRYEHSQFKGGTTQKIRIEQGKTAKKGKYSVRFEVQLTTNSSKNAVQNTTFIVDTLPDSNPLPSNNPTPSPSSGGCQAAPSITPGSTPGPVAKGTAVDYEFSVTNNNSGNCGQRWFRVRASLPSSQWFAEFVGLGNMTKTDVAKVDFKLSNGETKNLTLRVKSPAIATMGTKEIKVAAHNRGKNNSTKLSSSPLIPFAYVISDGSSPTPEPSSSPTDGPTPTPASGNGSVVLRLSLGLNTIGAAGTSLNPVPRTDPTTHESESNQNPRHVDRPVKVELVNPQGQVSNSAEGNVRYNPQNGRFEGEVTVTGFAADSYNILLTLNGFLKTQAAGILKVGSGQNSPVSVPIPNIVNGDVNMDNFLRLTDYNILRACVVDTNSDLCKENTTFRSNADLNDDNSWDDIDLTLWTREFSVRAGAQ